ncbi:MarR family winged helix-turn-helix transcriptional regulator [Actinosynnema pretiosum]|uniref:MarR family transcriptional regulator n=1 Tax=Actinosynnema pretiosum TaxID=42197 RepID=A0A290Z964_9PSEU|nr:MarR family winged helix-turn-helix transcriptional regulator [Actinosynnema pretiosum]ATE55525.1 MarR family transcriptional regulator [Actinosynnema pretiosum]
MPSKQRVGLAVKRLQWQHHREATRRLLAGAGLSLVQWDVLRHLREDPDASLRALAALTFQTDQSMGELARRMVERGLLRRVDGGGRAVRHALTDEGIAAHEAGSGIVDEVLEETVGVLTDRERAELLALLEKALGGRGQAPGGSA